MDNQTSGQFTMRAFYNSAPKSAKPVPFRPVSIGGTPWKPGAGAVPHLRMGPEVNSSIYTVTTQREGKADACADVFSLPGCADGLFWRESNFTATASMRSSCLQAHLVSATIACVAEQCFKSLQTDHTASLLAHASADIVHCDNLTSLREFEQALTSRKDSW